MRRLRRLGRAGKTRYGCPVSALVVVALLYYGVGLGGICLPGRLHARIDSLDVPLEAHRFTVRRFEQPPEIQITSSYTETVELPLTHFALHLHPVARAPLGRPAP